MSFAAVLLLCTVITGIMALAHKFYFSTRGDQSQLFNKALEQGRSFFPVFLLVLVLRSFLAEPFRIPSSSLEPTLLVGDFVLVNKFSYGLRFPVLDKKFLGLGDPKRGDVVVFSWPPNEKFDYIKRVIGLPGDKIIYKNKILTVNGVEAKQKLIKQTSFIDEQGELQDVELRKEQLNGIEHDIYVKPSDKPYDFEVTVPAGHYFMMGDNRDNSSDSRYWGLVADKNLRGKAVLTWMSWNGARSNVRWDRIGKMIH